MKRVALAVLVMTGAAHADPAASNPPFLGIEMAPMAQGVMITRITPNTGADRAGLVQGDIIIEIDHAPIPPASQVSAVNPADVLVQHITAHNSGDEVHLRILHGSQVIERTAILGSRTDLMEQKLVGNPIDVAATDFDSDRNFNLDELTGRTTVVGWTYRVDNVRCDDCARTMSRIDQRFKKMSSADGPRVVSATNDTKDNVQSDRKNLGSSLQTAIVASDDLTNALEFADPRRLSLTVVDCKGITRFVAVILPGAADEDAVIDELVAAVEQANHRTRR